MILTVTPNPSLDLLFQASRLAWDDANRIPLPRRRPGGQGVNVVRALRALDPGAPARAVALLGGGTGRDLESALALEGTSLRPVPGRGETRVFVGIRERDTGRALLLNPRGPDCGEPEAGALLDAVAAELDQSKKPGWVVCCGSLPPGLPADLYARIGRVARDRGHRFVADCDGEALRLAVEAGCDLLVPNVHEAERLLGSRIRGSRGAAEAARALTRLGAPAAVVTLGADGAVAASGESAWAAASELPTELADEVAEGSAVGAGDALLAALLLRLTGEKAELPGALADGVAAGTATLLSRGTDLLTAADFDRVRPHVRLEEIPG